MSVTTNVQKSISSSYVMYIASPPSTELREKKVLPRNEGSQPPPCLTASCKIIAYCVGKVNIKTHPQGCVFCFIKAFFSKTVPCMTRGNPPPVRAYLRQLSYRLLRRLQARDLLCDQRFLSRQDCVL